MIQRISTISPGLAKPYLSSITYEKGEWVLYHNAYWQCKTAILTPEEWTEEHWGKKDELLSIKADLVDGKVPESQLPSYVDDVIMYDAYSNFPTPGEDDKIYVDKSTDKSYRWATDRYVIIGSGAIKWGDITGSISENTDLSSELDSKLDKSDVVAPSKDAKTGQAADAKATGDGLSNISAAITNKADKSALDSHIADTTNPHAVTAEQIGAVPVSVLDNYYTSKQIDEAISKRRDKLDLDVYGYGNASVTFPDGFSIDYRSNEEYLYSAPPGGETIEFYGPISSTAMPDAKFWVPYEYKDITDFFPSDQGVWYLVCPSEQSLPDVLILGSGPYFIIGQFDSESPTLTLNSGEAYGGAPTMTRPIVSTGDALAKVSQVDAAISMISETNPTFSNAVLSVGLNIDTNSVAVLNEIARTFGGFPIEGTATTVGGLLAALSAAITWMKKNKADKTELETAIADLKDRLPYALVEKEIENGSVSLDDRADNYVDARTLGSSDSLDIDFPTIVDGKSRDFVLAVECGENPPTISYAAFVTIMAEDASTLAPEQGMNIYSFTEFKPNMFLAARKTVDTVVVNTPESADQMLIAMQKRGIDTTNITDFGVVADTLGLDDTATPQDAIDAVMN